MPIRKSSMGAIPFGSTAGRPASAATGQPYFNGTTGSLEVNTANGYVSISSLLVPAPTVAPTVVQSSSAVAATIQTTAVVTISAVAASGNVPSIDSYIISAYLNGTLVSSVTTTSLTATVTGLTANTTYTFSYVARYGTLQSTASPSTSFKTPIVVVFTSSQTWTVPSTGTYTLIAIGGGGGSGSAGNVANGGGSGRMTATAGVALTSGQSVVVTLGSGGGSAGDQGGTTSFVRSGTTLCSATGGDGGRGSATGHGGSGGGGGGDATGAAYPGPGGYWGSHGTKNPGGGTMFGNGQLGVAYGLGTDQRIPSGGAGSYAGNNGAAWAGLFGSGGGLSASTNENGIQRGGGAGGATWAQSGRSGNTGIAAAVG